MICKRKVFSTGQATDSCRLPAWGSALVPPGRTPSCGSVGRGPPDPGRAPDPSQRLPNDLQVVEAGCEGASKRPDHLAHGLPARANAGQEPHLADAHGGLGRERRNAVLGVGLRRAGERRGMGGVQMDYGSGPGPRLVEGPMAARRSRGHRRRDRKLRPHDLHRRLRPVPSRDGDRDPGWHRGDGRAFGQPERPGPGPPPPLGCFSGLAAHGRGACPWRRSRSRWDGREVMVRGLSDTGPPATRAAPS